jgi:hypothetical protein
LSKLLYPFHPLFGTEIEVFGAAGGERDLVYVRLANSTTRGVPAWMFDEAICAGIRSVERPTIDCHALLRLAQLLDSLRSDVHSAGHEPTITLSQDTNSLPSKSKSTSFGLGADTVKRMDSERDPNQVPAPVAGVAPVGRTERKHPKRRLS